MEVRTAAMDNWGTLGVLAVAIMVVLGIAVMAMVNGAREVRRGVRLWRAQRKKPTPGPSAQESLRREGR